MSRRAVEPEAAWELADLVGHAYALTAGVLAEVTAPSGLSVGEVVALIVAQAYPQGLSQTAWGRLQGVTRQRAHVVAGSLQTQGLVSTSKRGREAVARITPKGARLIGRLRPEVGEALSKTMIGLSAAQSAALRELLRALIASMEGEPQGGSGAAQPRS